MQILNIVRVGKKGVVTFINDRRICEAREFDAVLTREQVEALLTTPVGNEQEKKTEPVAPVAPKIPPPSGAPQTEAEWRELGKSLKIQNYHNLKLDTLKARIAAAAPSGAENSEK